MSKIQCKWCGRFTSNPTMHVPPSEVTALEPSEPVPLCRVCASETDFKSRHPVAAGVRVGIKSKQRQ